MLSSSALVIQWPPAEEHVRLLTTVVDSGLADCGEPIAHTGPPAEAAGSKAVYAYLSRVVGGGEPATHVFPPGESFILPVWTTAPQPPPVPPPHRRARLAGGGTQRTSPRMTPTPGSRLCT